MTMLLDDHAAMYLSATRAGLRPCIGLVVRFDESVSPQAVRAWAATLAGNPLGFGRRVVGSRVPGARSRWMPAREVPPIRYEPGPLGRHELNELLEEEVSSLPDPVGGFGWQVAAAGVEGGGTIMTLWTNHAYGDGRALLSTAFDHAPPTAGDLEGHAPARWPELRAEVMDVRRRLQLGVRGTARLGRDAVGSWLGPGSPGDLERLRPVLSAMRHERRRTGARTERRRLALAHVPVDAWDAAARQRGGSGTTLLVAALANLLRGARRDRGEEWRGPLRILLPVDTRRRRRQAGVEMTSNAVTGTMVGLDGAEQDHGTLDEVRRAVRAAIASADTSSERRSASSSVMVDALRLLPVSLSHRLAVWGQSAEGVASHVGAVPPHVGGLDGHQPAHVYLVGGPMMTDLTVCLGRTGDELTFGFVADAGRLGPGGTLPERVATELDAWGVPASVW